MATTKELLARYNELSDKPLKSWSKAKSVLKKRIATLETRQAEAESVDKVPQAAPENSGGDAGHSKTEVTPEPATADPVETTVNTEDRSVSDDVSAQMVCSYYRETPDSSNEEVQDESLFREEALSHYLDDAGEGHLLRISPRWINFTYRLLVAVTLSALVYILVAQVPIYERGQALLRIEDVTVLNASADGIIQTVDVLPGKDVSAGDVMIRFRSELEDAQMERAREEFELQLLARLRNPNDSEAENELRRLRPELERARSALDRTRIIAPRDGILQDVRIRPGDFIRAGQPVLSLAPTEPNYTVIAFLPGHVLPQLATGMPVRLRIEGYAYAEMNTTIESVGTQVIGPNEARRFLGSDVGDALSINGPVVVVRCALDQVIFSTSTQEYRVHDGMHAEAEVEVRREPILLRLIPALKALGNGGD